ncbi:wax ester/triacylglycerol synthase domain-containing protein [Streptomyces sp. NPDC058812]|uniref:wax ester/triacylglycerol synthase domain-containing protein n=1 Tax=unclassified Streptomyces TaxID=2593676 RepID=UPI003689481C
MGPRLPGGSRALTTSEAVLWRTESTEARLPVLALLTLDAAPEWDRLRSAVGHAVEAHPRLRTRLAEPPFGVGRPRWEPVPVLDLRHHLRRVRHPDGANGALDVAQTMATTPFDTAHPLWEAVLVDGPAATGASLVFKVHHALADGRSVQAMLSALCEDTSAAPRKPGPLRVVPPADARSDPPGRPGIPPLTGLTGLPGLPGAAADELRRLTGTAVHRLLTPLGTLSRLAMRPRATGRSCVSALTLPAPHSPALRERSHQRALHVLDVPRQTLRAAGRLVGGTTHDAFLASVLGGLRLYHEELGLTCRHLPMAIAVALPPRPGAVEAGNRFTGLRLAGLSGEANPLRRLEGVHTMVRAARADPLIDPDGLGPLSCLLAAAPGPAVRALARHLTASDVHCTYVAGPQQRLEVAGVGVAGIHPFAPVVNCGFSVAMCSYDYLCAIGVNIDSGAVKRPELLHSALKGGFREIENLVDK